MKHSILTLGIFICISLGLQAQHELGSLPYNYNALEPYIDSTTMQIHFNTHHGAYVNNLNKALENHPEWQNKPITQLMKELDKLPVSIQTMVRNNGGGHYNHQLFWSVMGKPNTTNMSKNFEIIIEESFGSVENFKAEFEKAALSRFGSGWAWLIITPTNELKITSTPNQDNTLMPFVEQRGYPILGLDVWEHAYYLKYQAKRAAYTKAFWNIVNWNAVEDLLRKAQEAQSL